MYAHLKQQFGTGESVWASSMDKLFYKECSDDIKSFQQKRGFDFHRFVNKPHVASSQAACFNLFMPIMKSNYAVDVLKAVKSDIASIDYSHLENGFAFEYWRDEPNNDGSKGLLGDHSVQAGTDADFALSYIDRKGNHCLWLVEHKLSEAEFTRCNVVHNGKHPAEEKLCPTLTVKSLIDNPQCYYSNTKHYRYWECTNKYIDSFPGLQSRTKVGCPFADGMCQLWRNVLLARAAQEKYGYDKVFFSVVKPEGNKALNKSIKDFKTIVDADIFSVFNPSTLVEAAKSTSDEALKAWAKWYSKTYYLPE